MTQNGNRGAMITMNGNGSSAPAPVMMNGRTDFSLSEAANLIQSLDHAHSYACSSAIEAAREVEEARKNARAAREIARRFMGSTSSSSVKMTLPELSNLLANGDNDSPSSYKHRSPGSSVSTPHRPLQPPSPPSRKVATDNNGSEIAKKKRKGAQSLGVDKQALRNSEELLRVTLELDKAKEALESEQMAHDETKSALSQAKLKTKQLESQMETLLAQMETSRESSGRTIDELERELSAERLRVQAAEADAEEALDLAQLNTESRQHLEGLLAKAYEQVEDLKAQLASKEHQLHSAMSMAHPPPPPPPHPPRRPPPPPPATRSIQRAPAGDVVKRSTGKVVRFADDIAFPMVPNKPDHPTATVSTPAPRPSRSMVAGGRQLLQRALGSNNSSPIGSSPVGSPPSVSSIDSIIESANKYRQMLQERIKSVNAIKEAEDVPSTPQSVPSSVSFSPASRGFGSPPELLAETSHNVAMILRESGKKLSLTGKWWNDQKMSKSDASMHVDTLARHYCTAVEVCNGFGLASLLSQLFELICLTYSKYSFFPQVLLDKRQKEIIELESLCSLWELGSSVNGDKNV